MTDDITITLSLSRDEAEWLSAAVGLDRTLTARSVYPKITRAIKRAESFVDADRPNDVPPQSILVDCAGCNGSKEVVINAFDEDGNDISYVRSCYYCYGTGKEYI